MWKTCETISIAPWLRSSFHLTINEKRPPAGRFFMAFSDFAAPWRYFHIKNGMLERNMTTSRWAHATTLIHTFLNSTI
jgi:hypothetical protein